MRLFDLDHIALLPYTTCNLKCSYCVTTNKKLSLGRWMEHSIEVLDFLKKQPQKAIMVSGGEPFIWKGWPVFFTSTPHIWYFLTNASFIPPWITLAKGSVRLFIAAYHRQQVSLDVFIRNIKTLQDLGFPVFVKIVYNGEDTQLKDIEQIQHEDIPASFAPMIGTTFSDLQITNAIMYSQSLMYKKRFMPYPYGNTRAHTICKAGTTASFEIDGCKLNRCSHISSFLALQGNVNHSYLRKESYACKRDYCACEWHTFGELDSTLNENTRWQVFVNTGKWK